MKEKLLNKAQWLMETGVILHLGINVLLALWMIVSYSSNDNNLERIITNSSMLTGVIIFLVIDTVMALLWLFSPLFHTLHLILFILLGWLIYPCVFIDLMVWRGWGAIAAFVYAPVLLVFLLIPYIVYGAGRKNRTKALSLHAPEPGEETE